MKLEIEVVEIESNPFFNVAGVVCVNQLDADLFEGGQLRVIRDGKVIDKTASICIYGAHAEDVCFLGLGAVHATNCLFPEEFSPGDRLSFDKIQKRNNPILRLTEMLNHPRFASRVDPSKKPPVLRLRYEGYQVDSIRKLY